tara:strand:- start:207 stop:884 length:678 start_codon:yes stop_codon:yes gene_type:complete
MNIHTLSLFPKLIENALNEGVIKKAVKNKLLNLNYYDLRDFGVGKHKQVDDTTYGGGPGMVLKPEPIFNGITKIKSDNLIDDCPIILMSPQGKILNQEQGKKISKFKDIIVIAGRYEGVDERIVSNLVSDEISIGDYILSGGELPAAIFIEVVARMIPGVVGNEESIELDSITNKMLKYPVYTKPKTFMGFKVPDILFSGNHKEISDWRNKKSYENTKNKRPDLI